MAFTEPQPVTGLTLSQDLDDLAIRYLATVQAIAFGTRFIIEAMQAAGHSLSTLFLCGGLSKNPLFVQMHADITEQFRTRHKSGMKSSEARVRKCRAEEWKELQARCRTREKALYLWEPGVPLPKKPSNVVISLMEIILKTGCSGVGVPGPCLVPSMPVVLSQEVESVLVGAAILGACASGDFTSVQDACSAPPWLEEEWAVTAGLTDDSSSALEKRHPLKARYYWHFANSGKVQTQSFLRVTLQTFKTASPCQDVKQLTNGVTMAQVLHQIDVAWFDESWLSRIKDDVGDNWRIKFLGQQISEELIPDLNQITECSDPVELGRLLQLILGCAVNCERKQEHIKNIMTLEESVQHVVMTAIQELMSKEIVNSPASDTVGELEQQLMSKEIVNSPASDTVGELEQQLKRALEELQEAIAEKEELKQRCQELDMQVTALQDEKNSLVSENEMMNEKLDQLDGSFDDPNTMVARKYFHAQLQLEQLQEENYRLEAAKDDYRVHCEELEKQLIEFQHRNDELTSLAEETRALKDEIDVLRATSDKANKLESTVEVYRQKLQDLNDLRKQVKSLQETNMMYMHNTVSLEEELKKANAARAQLETYKRQVQDLHTKLSLESKRADTLAFEMKRLEEKHEALLKEKERLIEQRDTLKETNEELRCSQAQQDHLNHADVSATKSYETLAAEIMPVEYREVFIRLQHENKMLRLQQEGTENERIEQLQEQLEQKHRKMNELETEQRLSKERIGELQQQIEDLQKSLQEQGSKTEGESVSKIVLTCMEKLTEVHEELQKKQELIEDLQPDISQNTQKISELEAALQKKDEDMKAMEERYKMYLEKARNVIKTLDPKLNPASAEIMLLRKQLAEKERRIEILESECKVAKFRDYEEKLIVSAWYNKSLAFQKLGMESRLVSGSGACKDTGVGPPPRSFLAQQRHITSTRRNLSVKVPAAASD
ncbi:Protein Hook-like protein 1 [Microtus ochrogaster]|uniref:Protein Hook homolog 3 n=1 Tax=Microtus ochrogaster TaxID=79684 RepID=A0A8J6GXT6_MICOH|nr:Protein Hook-like protein 1 [Microtus ochrogaster]